MKRLGTTMAVCVGLLTWLSSPLQAQEQGDDVTQGTVYDQHLGIERPYTRLRGSALPTYVVVEMFFYDASDSLDRSPEVWNAFLTQLGIERGGAAESILKDAVVEARQSVLLPSDDTPASATQRPPPTTVSEHVERKREQVVSLARIYASLLTRLDEEGYSLDELNDYLRRDVRTGTTFTVYPDPGSPVNLDALLLEEMRRFDNLLVTALTAAGARQANEGGQ